jgi:mevalonate kinase
LVAHVGELLTHLPGVTSHILTAIDGIAAEAKKLLESQDNITERLGQLISINQGLLNSIGVGHEKLDTVARLTKHIGWTKLTGAGGGGCALTLLKEGIIPTRLTTNVDVPAETLQHVEAELKANGFRPFEVELGGKGVGILTNVDESIMEAFKHNINALADTRWLHWN